MLTPDDEGFADEVAPHNRAVVHSPDVVVGATSTAGRGRGGPLGGRAGGAPDRAGHRARRDHPGHVGGPADHPPARRRRRWTRTTRVATIGAGAAWTDVVPVADAHGLTPVAGSSTHVGVVGYLLGGGLGPFARSHGFSSDRIESLTVVTGTGEVVEASADRAPRPVLGAARRQGRPRRGDAGAAAARRDARAVRRHPVLRRGAHRDRPARLAGVDRDRRRRDHDQRGDRPVPGVRGRAAVPAGPDRADAAVRAARRRGRGRGGHGTPARARARRSWTRSASCPSRGRREIHNDPVDPAPSWVRGLMLSHADDDLATAWLERRRTGRRPRRSWPSSCGTSPAPRAWTCPAGRPSRGAGPRSSPASSGVDPTQFGTTHAGRGGRSSPRPSRRGRRRSSTRTSPGRARAVWDAATADRLAQVRRTYDPAGVSRR